MIAHAHKRLRPFPRDSVERVEMDRERAGKFVCRFHTPGTLIFLDSVFFFLEGMKEERRK